MTKPPPVNQRALESLLADLRSAVIGTTHNQFIGPGGDARMGNVRAYLATRAGADVLAVGEAGGYRGARWSGIAFTSERQLMEWGPPFAVTSDRPGGWTEPSATIVHGALRDLDAEQRVVLWNVVPHHPHRPGAPLSNRRPTAAEARAGAAFLHRVIELVAPSQVIAVGRVAEAALPGVPVVRHPAQGGATAFRAGITALLGR